MLQITPDEDRIAQAEQAARKVAADEWFAQKVSEGFESSAAHPYGGKRIKLGLTQGDVSLLTGNYVLAKEAATLGMPVPPIVDVTGEVHQLSIEGLTQLMLEYGQARALLSAIYADMLAGETPPDVEPEPEPEPEPEDEDEEEPEEDTPEEE
jgi:hypothetical protein